ncbi:MAG: macro domain-containing protein [Planctomycetota bacterium]
MIREVSGDILLSKAQILVHGVAPHDHFDNGLALALRQRWPVMVRDFRHHCHQSNPKPGGLWSWGGVGGVRIINLLTQEPAPSKSSKPRKATLPNINHCLRELRKLIETEGIKSVALPRLATGVGGLEWDDVRAEVVSHLGDLKIPVFVYTTYRSGVAADEELAASS